MQIAKWGNSLAVRLPKSLVEALDLKPGDTIEIVAASQTRIEIKRDDTRKHALDRLRSLRWKLPKNYRFDREEANER